MANTLRGAIEGAKEELRDYVRDHAAEYREWIGDDVSDYMFELCDGWVPVYNSTILDFAREDMDLILETPSVGRGETPLQDIQWNVLDRLQQEMYTYMSETLEREIGKDLETLDDLEDALDDLEGPAEGPDTYELYMESVPEYLMGLADEIYNDWRKLYAEED